MGLSTAEAVGVTPAPPVMAGPAPGEDASSAQAATLTPVHDVVLSPAHAELRRLLALLPPAARSADLDTVLRYYVGTGRAYDAAAEAAVRYLAPSPD